MKIPNSGPLEITDRNWRTFSSSTTFAHCCRRFKRFPQITHSNHHRGPRPTTSSATKRSEGGGGGGILGQQQPGRSSLWSFKEYLPEWERCGDRPQSSWTITGSGRHHNEASHTTVCPFAIHPTSLPPRPAAAEVVRPLDCSMESMRSQSVQ